MARVKSNNKGFSLVELIIVIAIMAVLVGVLAPQYLKYVEKSKAAVDEDNADSLLNAAYVVVADADYYDDVGNDIEIVLSNSGVTMTPADTALTNGLNQYFASWSTVKLKSKTYSNKEFIVELKQNNQIFDITSSWQE